MSEETEQQQEHERKMARIASRQAAFQRSPVIFFLWDIFTFSLRCLFWLGFWALVFQWRCGCVWHP